MQKASFKALADIAAARSGQLVTPAHSYAIAARLSPILRREGFGSVDDLVHCIKVRDNPILIDEVSAAMTSKHSFFFRERETLHKLVDEILPQKLRASSVGRLKVWCVGGGAGFEAYSIAILLQEQAKQLGGGQVSILSTDICKSQTALARDGAFGHFDVQKGLSIHRLLSHFRQLDTGQWQISSDLRASISFRDHNAMASADGLGKHDIILCRNVLTGMTRDNHMRVVENLRQQLLPQGILITGRRESLLGVSAKLEPSMDYEGTWVAAGTANERAA